MKYALLLSIFTAASQGSPLFQVRVDTGSLAANTTGFIDLAFNGGYPATATISSYSMTGGSLNASSISTFGTVSGTLPGVVTLSDDNTDYDEGLTFGTSLSFLLNFSGEVDEIAMEIEFLYRLRDEMKFQNPAILKVQIQEDARRSQKFFRLLKQYRERPGSSNSRLLESSGR